MSALSLFDLARWELRRLVAERTGVVLILLWCGLVAVAAYQGQRHTTAKHAEILAAHQADTKAWAFKRARLAEIESGLAKSEPFADPRSPTNAIMGRSGERPVVLVPTPLAAVSAGSGDLAPAVLRTGMITKLLAPAQSIENPANRLAGPLDLTFLVSALLPLFVLALSFDVLARERDAKIWPLLASQPTSVPRIVTARLAVHFAALWLPLAAATFLAALASHAGPHASILSALAEVTLWLGLAAVYLLFWQLLAAALNFRARSAATNAVLLAGAWLASVLLIPSALDAAVQAAAPPPDRRAFLLEVREVETDLFKRADELRDAYYAANPSDRPQVALNEYDAYFVQNLYPRALAADAALAPTLASVARARAAQARAWRALAWLSPTLAFRLATEQLAGVTPVQRSVLPERAREFQTHMRAVFGSHLASMRSLTLADYGRVPEPPVLRLPFTTRFRDAWPAVAGVLGAALVLALVLRRATASRRAAFAG
jgi:ABC-2 type transport system permease protein